MAVINLTNLNFEDEVMRSDKPVLIDFFANWCGPCRMVSPLVDEIAEERSDVKVVAVNIDENPDLADEFDIVSIPCVILFKGGAEADRSVGLVPKDVLEEMI